MKQRDQPNSTNTRSKPVPDLKGLLSRLMISGGVVLTGVVVTTGLSLILQASGDHTGASAVQWLAWVAAGCFAIILVALLASVTFAVLQLMEQASNKTASEQPQALPTRQQSTDKTTD